MIFVTTGKSAFCDKKKESYHDKKIGGPLYTIGRFSGIVARSWYIINADPWHSDPMTLYRNKQHAFAALRPGERVYRVVGSDRKNTFQNLTETAVLEQIKLFEVHETGETGGRDETKVFMDIDMKVKQPTEEGERMLCDKVAMLALATYFAAAGARSDCVRDFADTMVQTEGGPGEGNEWYECACGYCPKIRVPDVDLYTSHRPSAKDETFKYSVHAVVTGDRRPAGSRIMTIACLATLGVLELTDSFVYTGCEGQQKCAVDPGPSISKSLRVRGSAKSGDAASRKIHARAYQRGLRCGLSSTDMDASGLRKSLVFAPGVPPWDGSQLHVTMEDAFYAVITNMHTLGLQIPKLPKEELRHAADAGGKKKRKRKEFDKNAAIASVNAAHLTHNLKVLQTAVGRSLGTKVGIVSVAVRNRSPGYGNRDEVVQEIVAQTDCTQCPLRPGGGTHTSNRMSIKAVQNGPDGRQHGVVVTVQCPSSNHIHGATQSAILVDPREWHGQAIDAPSTT